MIRFLLTKFWPTLIPIALYLLWYLYKRYKLRNSEEVVKLTDGPWAATLMTAMALAAAGFIWLGVTDEKTGPVSYTPPVLKDGKIIDGRIRGQ